jgi:hypothetical protein
MHIAKIDIFSRALVVLYIPLCGETSNFSSRRTEILTCNSETTNRSSGGTEITTLNIRGIKTYKHIFGE